MVADTDVLAGFVHVNGGVPQEEGVAGTGEVSANVARYAVRRRRWYRCTYTPELHGRLRITARSSQQCTHTNELSVLEVP